MKILLNTFFLKIPNMNTCKKGRLLQLTLLTTIDAIHIETKTVYKAI